MEEYIHKYIDYNNVSFQTVYNRIYDTNLFRKYFNFNSNDTYDKCINKLYLWCLENTNKNTNKNTNIDDISFKDKIPKHILDVIIHNYDVIKKKNGHNSTICSGCGNAASLKF